MALLCHVQTLPYAAKIRFSPTVTGNHHYCWIALTKLQRNILCILAFLLHQLLNLYLNNSIIDMLKKIDYYAQLLIAASTILSLIIIPFVKSAFIWSLISLFFLGVWQLISALVHSFIAPAGTISKKLLTKYWILCVGAIIILILSFSIRDFQKNTMAIALFIASLVYSFGVGVYYLYSLKKYILNNA